MTSRIVHSAQSLRQHLLYSPGILTVWYTAYAQPGCAYAVYQTVKIRMFVIEAVTASMTNIRPGRD